jgi:hypothetical protein
MRLILSIILASAAFICGMVAANFWRLSTNVRPEPEGFEPVDPDVQQLWRSSANDKASETSSSLNQRASWWTGVAALLGFASFLASEFINSNQDTTGFSRRWTSSKFPTIE